MSLEYILKRVESSSGVSSPDLNPEQVLLLIDFINEACQEIYNSKDLPVVLKEVQIRATNNTRLALPPFVGEIRAARTRRFNNLWSLHDMRPRYSQNDWDTKNNKLRIIGESPLANELTVSDIVILEYPVIDNTLITTIKGETSNSNNAIDSITQSNVSVNGTKQYIDISSIKKNKLTDYNILVKDVNGVEISMIYADQLEARYLIVDVSQYLTMQDCSDGTFGIEVLYKPRLNKLVNLEDEFPLQGYDDTIVLRTKQLLAEDEPGQEERAILMNQKSKVKLDELINSKSTTTQKRLAMGKNPLMDLKRYWRTYWPM